MRQLKGTIQIGVEKGQTSSERKFNGLLGSISTAMRISHNGRWKQQMSIQTLLTMRIHGMSDGLWKVVDFLGFPLSRVNPARVKEVFVHVEVWFPFRSRLKGRARVSKRKCKGWDSLECLRMDASTSQESCVVTSKGNRKNFYSKKRFPLGIVFRVVLVESLISEKHCKFHEFCAV